MLDWMWKGGWRAHLQRAAPDEVPKPASRVMSGTYLRLYTYLERRYANTLVLTFAQIEDLLGFALPNDARVHQAWWTHAEIDAGGSSYSDAWILASRTAVPNLLAGTVVFERAS